MWNKILRKGNYALKTPGRPTDEDELMNAVRVFIQKQVPSKLTKKESANLPPDSNLSINAVFVHQVKRIQTCERGVSR